MAFVAPALPAIAAVAGIAGAGISAMGAIEAGKAQQAQMAYQAQVANNNAIVANQNANYAIEAGEAKAENESRKAAAVQGRVRAALAANDIDPNTGSAVDIEESTREQGKLDTETVMSNANLEAYGYRTQGLNFTSQAGLYSAEAEQAPIGAGFTAAGGLLGNASSIGLKWAGTQNSNQPLQL